jgi:hypothetical protein
LPDKPEGDFGQSDAAGSAGRGAKATDTYGIAAEGCVAEHSV